VRRLLVVLIAVVAVGGGLSVVSQSAGATVPGAVGRIVFTGMEHNTAGEIYTRDSRVGLGRV
jgi:hypothetical protein